MTRPEVLTGQPLLQGGAFGLRTASKIAWRDLRSSPGKFVFVILAVAVGVAALSGVKGFGYAFRGMLLRNAKQLIAADLQAQTWEDVSADQLAKLDALGAQVGRLTRVTETVSMAGSNRSRVPQMIAVKAIDPESYPFYGKLGLNPSKPLRELLADDQSTVVTSELQIRLKVKLGDTLRIGGQDYRITGAITFEPDRLASGFGPGMRAFVSRAGLDRSRLIQFGSRAGQRFLFQLKPGVDLDKTKDEVKQTLHRVYLSDFRQGSPIVGKALDNTTTFLSLVSLISLIVGSLGVAMAMYSHIQQHLDTVAVMKAVGARAYQVTLIYLLQTLLLGLAGGLIGISVGALVQKSFPLLIERIFALLPQVPWDWSFSLQGLALGILATLLFTLPPLLGIRNIRPNLVFRRNMLEAAEAGRHQWRDRLPAWSGSAIILAGFYGVAVWLGGSAIMGLYFIGGLVVSILLLAAVAWLLLWALRRVVNAIGWRLPASFRHGFANLYRPGNQARSVLVALGIGVMFTLTTYLLQNVVLAQVTREGPGQQGNLFLLDIRDVASLRKTVEGQPGVQSKIQMVGYIVSRMLSRNNIAADRLNLSRERREDLQTLRLTVADAKPEGLTIEHGSWWRTGSSTIQIALSEQAARDFHLGIGDQLVFQAGGRNLTSPVVAIFKRSNRAPVRYDFVLPQNSIAGIPVVYYGAVHVKPPAIPALEADIFERFPTITVVNLADVLMRIQEAIDQVAVVVRFLALFAIFAGIIILSSSIAGTRSRRVREVAILKALGATRRRITAIFSVEFTILGVAAGIVGAVLANLFTAVISNKFIEADFRFDPTASLLTVCATALLANLAGWLASLGILGEKPLEILRAE